MKYESKNRRFSITVNGKKDLLLMHEMTVEEFAGFVESQQPSPDEAGAEKMLEILSCEMAGDTADVDVLVDLLLGLSRHARDGHNNQGDQGEGPRFHEFNSISKKYG